MVDLTGYRTALFIAITPSNIFCVHKNELVLCLLLGYSIITYSNEAHLYASGCINLNDDFESKQFDVLHEKKFR